MPQPKINLMNKFQLCLSRWLVARKLKMNFAPPNLRKFKLFWASPAPIYFWHMRLGKCYEVLIQEAAFSFQSQSQLFFFPLRELHIWLWGQNCFCQLILLPNSHAHSASCPLHLFFARRVTPEKIYSHSKRTFNIYFVNVPSQRADSTG